MARYKSEEDQIRFPSVTCVLCFFLQLNGGSDHVTTPIVQGDIELDMHFVWHVFEARMVLEQKPKTVETLPKK